MMGDMAPRSDEPCIRGEYEKHGVEAYYRSFGGEYRNPHEPQIGDALRRGHEQWRLDLSRVLDLAAGSGEATLVLQSLGAEQISGVDPFTSEAYQARIGRPARSYSFEDIAAGALASERYSLIVCSFALHLCEPSRLPALLFQLSQIAPQLLVLSPHKRPVIRSDWGWRLREELVVQRVRVRLYEARVNSR